ncbi:hypothetical protein ZZ1p0216 [Acinetobacter phage ZZ1]|uniref:Uncharacterized protein n=1 Tax=Acinetobacter phage ZZ1 TaxID=1049283 RepID=I3WW39_9CAUD|nr:hypothetical protein ZZ1p0216 [Acinetobacter phage ZZ1]AFL47709.1 hypothetical protein ZZ1p0216 [Acinetobacter phage ZZ1]
MKPFSQIAEESKFQLNEGYSSTLKQVEYDLIDANADRKPGDHGVNKAGKEFKDIVILEASKTTLRFVQKKGSDFQINEYDKSANKAQYMSVYSGDLKYFK